MIEQRSEAWFAQRKGRVTGSVVGGILGLSPYMTRDDVLRSMVRATLNAPSEFTGNVATEWGTGMERQAILDFEMSQEVKVKPAPFVEYEDWLGASPDGYVEDDALIEVKCPYSLRNDPEPIFKTPGEQLHYLAQMQVQMFVTDRKECRFYQWTPHDCRLDTVYRDDNWLAHHIPALRQFHAEYIDALAAPDEHLAPRRITIDTPDAAMMVREYDDLKEARDRADERLKELMAGMAALAGDRNALFGGRKLTKIEKEGAVSYAKVVKEKLPDLDLSAWRGKPSSFWKLS